MPERQSDEAVVRRNEQVSTLPLKKTGAPEALFQCMK